MTSGRVNVRRQGIRTTMLAMLRGLMGDAEERDASGKPKVTLRRALDRGWLELWYQPKVALRDQHLVGAEGLIRVRHPEIGMVPPFQFLTDACADDMLEMTEKVIVAALADWHECAAAGLPEIKLAVNVPADAFVRLPITRMIRELKPRADNWPGLILEVTEDQALNDLDMANEVAAELRTLDCSLAIDDFGAGYSSLARLRQLPFSELKIDRAYVTDCHLDRVKSGMLETIIEMAHRFGLKTVAEGIETPHEGHKLQGLGCVVGQGYLFAKPMPKEEFFTRIERSTGKRRADQKSWFTRAPKAKATV
jgi:EAL domain-containing protein (putative c-di-GMP-specific phosphodiesterase class I)